MCDSVGYAFVDNRDVIIPLFCCLTIFPKHINCLYVHHTQNHQNIKNVVTVWKWIVQHCESKVKQRMCFVGDLSICMITVLLTCRLLLYILALPSTRHIWWYQVWRTWSVNVCFGPNSWQLFVCSVPFSVGYLPAFLSIASYHVLNTFQLIFFSVLQECLLSSHPHPLNKQWCN